MPLIARQRSRLAVLAVLALVGSLLAVSAVPVAAEPDEKPSAEAMYSACVAAATEDAGFTDIDGSFAEDSADCLAHYGVTQGTSEGVFGPSASITRLQMALFMVRSAGVAGIEMDDTEDQGFGDIAGLTDEIQDAINQAAALEIMAGTSDDEFSPLGMVSRASMAVILDGFLAAAGVELDEDLEIDEPFSDVSSVSFAAYGAINRLYEWGVATGTGDGSTFSPGDLVSRGQMAVFVTRALAHTNARPEGLSMQAAPMDVTDNDATTLQVSLRDGDHQPVPDELIEVFSATSTDDAFDDDGACEKNDGDSPTYGTTRCEIDAADEATDPDGNVILDVETAGFCPGSMVFYAWSGDISDTYDNDETDKAWTMISVTKAATQVLITSDVADDATYLEFGDSLTVTFQVANADDDPVGMEDLAITVRTVESVDGTDVRTLQNEHKTDASGRVELTFSADDPDTAKDEENMVTLDLDLISVMDADGTSSLDQTDESGLVTNDANEEDAETDPDATVSWTDSKPVATKLSLSQSIAYHEASRDASGVRHTVQATLVDQYGDPISGVKVRFWSDANNGDDAGDDPTANDGLGGLNRLDSNDAATDDNDDPDLRQVAGTVEHYADERTTNRRGVATKFYNRDSEASQVEVIRAAYNLDSENDTVGLDNERGTDDDVAVFDADEGEIVMINHYWAVEADTGDTIASDTVVVIDTDSNLVVVRDETSHTVWIVNYDGNDQFTDTTGAVTMSGFEASLMDGSEDGGDATATLLTASLAADPGDGVNTVENTNGRGPDADPCAA